MAASTNHGRNVQILETRYKPLFLFATTISLLLAHTHTTIITSCILSTLLSTMIGSSTGSIVLALLAALSVSPAVAAPQGGSVRVPHYPYKDYHSGHSPHRQNANVPTSVSDCTLSPREPIAKGDQEFPSNGIRYSQSCLDQLGFTLVPEERAACHTECPGCISARGYDMPCIAERVLQRSSEGDLSEFKDLREPVNTTLSTLRKFTLTFSPPDQSNDSKQGCGLSRLSGRIPPSPL